MTFSKKHYIIGAVLILVLALGYLATSGKSAESTTGNLQKELTVWGKEYGEKAVLKTKADQDSLTLKEDMRVLACNALANRITLCQRGDDTYCKQEADARASMILSFGAPFETVCQKGFQQQVTAL